MTIDTTKVNIFEEATRMKLRFDTVKGSNSVEDIWTLPLTHSHMLSIKSVLSNVTEQFNKLTNSNDLIKDEKKEYILSLKIAILKAIIKRKEADAQAILDEKKRKDDLAELDRLIDEKSRSELSNKSIDELKEMRENLLKK